MRLLLRTALIVAGLLALAACNGSEPAPDAPELPGGGQATATPVPSGSQRIVLVGPRFDIWTVRGNGGDPARLTGERSRGTPGTDVAFRAQQEQRVRYTWPTWSPDGRSVVVSRTPGTGGNALASLVLFDTGGGRERQLHETLPGAIPLVANGAPHYALWAPTSEFLSFVAPRGPGESLGLFVVRPGNGEPYEVTADAPLYHVWSPGGRYVLVHRREQLLLHDTSDRSTIDLDADSLRYRVPAFSPDGEGIAYVVEDGDAGKLVTSRTDGTNRVAVMDIPGQAAFAWSPDGGRIAVGTRGFSSVLSDGLYVVDEDGTGAGEPLVRDKTGAFYWSPDGSRIAYVTVDGSMEWRSVDAATGETRSLARFIPTPDFLTHLQFFDQFAPSHLVWSADSAKLVFAGVMEGEAVQRVWVVDAKAHVPPTSIAEGRLAFWAPPAKE